MFNSVTSSPLSLPSPEYSFKSTGDNYQIVVDCDVKNHGEKEGMIEEAKKSSLMGMAFINKLASENNIVAQQVSSFYEAYRNYFIKRDKDVFFKTCQSIIDDSSADGLTKEMASYVKNIIEQKKTLQSDGKILIKNLIPFIKYTLLLESPKIILKERIVKIPEMQARHNAFPDLIKYNNYYYAAFREAQSHVGYQDFGKIRILRGEYSQDSDEWQWENIALLTNEPFDLRDPKFFIDAHNQLCLILDGSLISQENTTEKMVPHVAYQVDKEWKIKEAKVDNSANGDIGQWIWRVTWNHLNQSGYSFSYGKNNVLSLMKTTDGISYEKVVEVSTNKLQGENLTEATIRFKADGSAVALIRTQKHGLIGTSNIDSNYTNWSFNVIPFRLGGPNFVFSQNEEVMWAGTRHFFLNRDNTLDEATVIAQMDEKRIIPLLRLESNLDNSYPGMVLEDNGNLTVLYYSSEPENKSNIYITRVKLP